MASKVTRKLRQILKGSEVEKPYENVVFPGGIVPIHSTNENDVFVVGFPKSGNTLMQHIITHLVYGINAQGSRSLVNLIVPDIYSNTHYFRINDRCFFKSHDLPKPEYKNVIYIVRDGREALLSYYYMMENMGKSISLEDLYTGKHKIYDSLWFEHVRDWELNPYNANILWIRYEDLISNKLEELKKIAAYLGIKRTGNELENVLKLTTLEHMRTLENREDWKRMKENKFESKKAFIRKGQLSSYKDEVKTELVETFIEMNKEILEKYYKIE